MCTEKEVLLTDGIKYKLKSSVLGGEAQGHNMEVRALAGQEK